MAICTRTWAADVSNDACASDADPAAPRPLVWTTPSKIGVPSRSVTDSATRAGPGARLRSPGTRGAGSHTNVTRVAPFDPGAMPNHGRMSALVRRGNCAANGSAARTALARSTTGAATQYPWRTRRLTPGRRIDTDTG